MTLAQKIVEVAEGEAFYAREIGALTDIDCRAVVPERRGP